MKYYNYLFAIYPPGFSEVVTVSNPLVLDSIVENKLSFIFNTFQHVVQQTPTAWVSFLESIGYQKPKFFNFLAIHSMSIQATTSERLYQTLLLKEDQFTIIKVHYWGITDLLASIGGIFSF
jgi:hypothetical protein